MGVDSAYFMQIISILRKKQEETKAEQIDGTYLMTLIDKLF